MKQTTETTEDTEKIRAATLLFLPFSVSSVVSVVHCGGVSPCSVTFTSIFCPSGPPRRIDSVTVSPTLCSSRAASRSSIVCTGLPSTAVMMSPSRRRRAEYDCKPALAAGPFGVTLAIITPGKLLFRISRSGT